MARFANASERRYSTELNYDEDDKLAPRFAPGDIVFVRDCGLWCKGTFIQENVDGTFRARVGHNRRNRIDVPWQDIIPIKTYHEKH